MLHILMVLGTRPEIIKCAPLIQFFKQNSEQFKVTVVSTGQHRVDARSILWGV